MNDTALLFLVLFAGIILVLLFWYFIVLRYRNPFDKDPVNRHVIVKTVSGINTVDLRRGTEGGAAFEESRTAETILMDNDNRRRICAMELTNTDTGEIRNISFTDALKIGRAPAKEAGVTVLSFQDDQGISREQCLISLHGKTLHIKDLRSQNHTLINGNRIDGECELHDGDLMEIGRTKLKVSFTIR